jgi:SHS2 domain-containing protein
VSSIDARAAADTPEALVVGLLNDMIYYFDTYGFIGRRVEILDRDRSTIRARVHGEEFDAERHESRLLVKAATFHDIRVADAGDHWEVEVIFDI